MVAKIDPDTPVIELRNLGPACEADLQAVDIHTLGDILELGVEGTFELLMVSKMARNKGGTCFNAAYLYALYGAVHDLDWQDLPDRKKEQFKKLTAKLRQEHAP